jgi:hypothetical protein
VRPSTSSISCMAAAWKEYWPDPGTPAKLRVAMLLVKPM